ncbi:MAG TPA: hypothetical protein VLV86_22800 [Vicinamibacterales bacterium]|nr:hypothetical protein [Vicinamibacterales bacterium]
MRVAVALAATLTLCSPAAAQWKNYPPAPSLAGPAPNTADGKPDLSGVWQADGQSYFFDLAAGLKPEDVVALPWARALQQQREANLHGDDPLARCLPHGVPRVNTNGLFPFKIVQTPTLVVLLYEQLNLFRQVFLDGRTLTDDVNPTWLGYSTGRWEGDTLVVDTKGFNDKTWLDTQKGRPASDALHVIERFRRPKYGDLEVVATIDDPKAYAKPWTTATQHFRLQPTTDLLEFVCPENEKDRPHMVGK